VPERVALLGFLPSRVFTLIRDGTDFAAPPLMALHHGRERPFQRTFRVSIPVEVGWSLSRLPTLLGFFAS
jgi:hypothetical protein